MCSPASVRYAVLYSDADDVLLKENPLKYQPCNFCCYGITLDDFLFSAWKISAQEMYFTSLIIFYPLPSNIYPHPSRIMARFKPCRLNHVKLWNVGTETFSQYFPEAVNTKQWKSNALRDRKSTRLNSSHSGESRMPSSA